MKVSMCVSVCTVYLSVCRCCVTHEMVKKSPGVTLLGIPDGRGKITLEANWQLEGREKERGALAS